MECPRATERIRIGLPLTIESPTVTAKGPSGGSAAGNSDVNATLVVAATENFITFLDAIKLGLTEKDVLHPYLVEIIQAVNKVTDQEFENKGQIVSWLIKLNQMRASEKLSEEQVRQLDFDINQAYRGFKGTLKRDPA